MKKIIRNILIVFVLIVFALPALITGTTRLICEYDEARKLVKDPDGSVQYDEKWAPYYSWINKDNSDGTYQKIKNYVDENINAAEIITRVTAPAFNSALRKEVVHDTFGSTFYSYLPE